MSEKIKMIFTVQIQTGTISKTGGAHFSTLENERAGADLVTEILYHQMFSNNIHRDTLQTFSTDTLSMPIKIFTSNSILGKTL